MSIFICIWEACGSGREGRREGGREGRREGGMEVGREKVGICGRKILSRFSIRGQSLVWPWGVRGKG